jgi:hypothetical protein
MPDHDAGAPEQDQTRLSGIAPRPGGHSPGFGSYEEDGGEQSLAVAVH